MSADSAASPYRLDLARQELTREDGVVSLAPKVLRLLQCLVEAGGRIVSHDELLADVWAGVRVSGDAVRYSVRELRKALDDDPRTPHFVETVPRKGWRFVGQAVAAGTRAWLLLPSGADVGTTAAAAAPAPDAAVRVGRADERLALRRALSLAQSGERQLGVVSGEAGLGKTTLVEQFLEGLAAQEAIRIGRGRSIERHGPSEPYAPILEALQQLATQMGPIAIETLRRYAPMWLAALPALTDPEQRGALHDEIQGATPARMLRELVTALEALAAQHTIVLWLDDLHWADLSTFEALSALMQHEGPARILIIAAQRPAEAPDALRTLLRELEIQKHGTEIELPPLGRGDATDYARSRFGFGDDAANALGAFLHDTTEGNALFLVSVADNLVERGELSEASGRWKIEGPLATVDVPANVRLLLEREFERVGAEESVVLEVASLAGMSFSAATIAAACEFETEEVEATCEALCRRGSFLVADGSENWPDGTNASRYAFRHGLHRDVLSAQLPTARRTRIHGEIADRLASAYPELHAGEVAARLAGHFELAGRAEEAVHFHTLAGERASERSAHPEAAVHLRRALALLPAVADPVRRDALEIPARLMLNVPLAAIDGYASPELETNLDRFLALTGEFAESTAAFPVMLGLWALTIARADLERASDLGTRLLRIAEREGDAMSRLQAHRTLGHTRFYEGKLRASLDHLREALVDYDVDGHERQDHRIGDDPLTLTYAYGTWSHWFFGEPETALRCGGRALAVAERIDHPPSLVFARFYVAMLHCLRRDPERALPAAEAAAEMAQYEGMGFWGALANLLRGVGALAQGDEREGISIIERSYDAWNATGGEAGRPFFLTLIADAYRQVGRVDEGLALLPAIDEGISRTGQQVFITERHRVEGLLLADAGRIEDAAASLKRAIHIAERHHVLGIALRAANDLATLHDAHGVAPEAAERLRGVVFGFEQGESEPEMRRARAWLEPTR